MSRRCLLSLLALHVTAAYQEVNLVCKTPLPTSGGANGVQALVGVLPQEGEWGALFEVEREDRVVAKVSISRRESKTGSEAAYDDHLGIQCGNETPQAFDSPWPTAWLSGEAKGLLFRVSNNLIEVLQKEGSSEMPIASDMCKINPSNVSFSASNLPNLPAPTLSLGCPDGELKNSTEAESGKEPTRTCQEVNLVCKTPLPTSGGADGVEALVGVRPQEGDWGALFEVEQEDQVVAKISISRRENKTGNETAYNDRLAFQCEDTSLPFDSPLPTDWLSGEAKCLLFRVSDNVTGVLQKEGSLELHIGSDICKINLSNVSFSASNLLNLPAPTLSLGCADGELKNATETESEETQTGSVPLYVAGFITLLAVVLSTVNLFIILSLRKRLLALRMTGSGAEGDDNPMWNWRNAK